MIDFNRRTLRSQIIQEGLRAAQDKAPALIETAIAKAMEQYFLEVAEYIQAYAEFAARNFNNALSHLEKALKLDPAFGQAHVLKGALLIEMKDYEGAITSADYSIQHLVLASYAVFYCNKGVAFNRLGRSNEAIFCFLQAIEDDGNYELAYKNLLTTVGEKELYLDVLKISAMIREKFPSNPALLNWTSIYLLNRVERSLRQAKPEQSTHLAEEAGKQLNLAIVRDPDNHSILYNLACYYSRVGDRSQAIATLKKAFEKAASANAKVVLQTEARTDPDFANIREDPEFRNVVAAS